MKKRIEKMIPLAIEAIESKFKDKEGHTKPIPRTFQGSISGMGASILQMGLLPTLAVFADEESGTKDDQRIPLLDILSYVLANYEGYKDAAKFQNKNAKSTLEVAAKMGADDRKKLKKHLLDAAVAVKLSLRTFKLEQA